MGLQERLPALFAPHPGHDQIEHDDMDAEQPGFLGRTPLEPVLGLHGRQKGFLNQIFDDGPVLNPGQRKVKKRITIRIHPQVGIYFWGNLSRLNHLPVIVNISMFFLSGLVAKGYFYTFYSLVCLGVVAVGVLVPTTLIRRLWYCWIFLAIELSGLYFLVASVVY